MVTRRSLVSAVASGSVFGALTGRFLTGRAAGSHEGTSGQRPDRVQRVEPDPDYGFHHPYFLATPASYRPGEVPLLLEMNNADETLSPEEERRRAKGQVRGLGAHGAWLSEELGVPHLKPLFPENPGEDPIEDRHEISLLDRSTMLLDGTDLDRVDRQLLRMADHARETVLSDALDGVAGSSLHEQLLMYGNSSEGVSAERMAAMHPEAFLAIAAAGLNGMALLPLEALGGRSLDYHVGVADLEAVTGTAYDARAHDAVDLLLIQGGEDRSNRLLMDEEEALRRGTTGKGNEALYRTARATFGPRMVEDRFPRCHVAFEKAGVSAQFRVVPGMPHDDSQAMHDVREFLRRSIEGEDVGDFGQRFRLPFDRTVDLRTAAPSVGDPLTFGVSGEYPPLEGLVTYTWAVDDGRSSSGPTATFTFDEPGDYEVTLGFETAHGQSGQLGLSLLGDGSSFAAFQYAVDVPGPRHLAAGTEFLVGESMAIDIEVANLGSVAGERVLEFLVGGERLSSERVELEPSAGTTVTFEHAFEEPGEVDVRVPPAYAETVTVEARAPAFTLVEAELSAAELAAGQPVEVRATVENSGTGAGELPLTLRANGETVATGRVTLEVGATETVAFEPVLDRPGDYELTLNGEFVGSVTVEPGATATDGSSGAGPSPTTTDAHPSSEGTTSPGQPGFGLVPALAGIATAVSYLASLTGSGEE